MFEYLVVAAGGAFGSVARFWLTQAVDQRTANGFPWGTLLVNVSGCFLIGVIGELVSLRPLASPYIRPGLMAGFLGGYTTFSAFSLQTVSLAQQGRMSQAALYVFLSVAACLVGVWLGQILGRALSA